MKTAIATTFLAATALLAEPPAPKPEPLYRWSVAYAVGAAALDVGSSLHAQSVGTCHEINPILSRGGQFNGQSVAIKSAITGGVLLLNHFTRRRAPKWAAASNFAMGSISMVAGINNLARCR